MTFVRGIIVALAVAFSSSNAGADVVERVVAATQAERHGLACVYLEGVRRVRRVDHQGRRRGPGQLLREAVQRLHEQGIKLVMCTGDTQATAEAVARLDLLAAGRNKESPH